MNKKVTLSIHYENGTAYLYSIASYVIERYVQECGLHYTDDICVTTQIVTLAEAVQIVSRLGLE